MTTEVNSLLRQEAAKLVAQKVDEAYNALTEAQRLADKHDLAFSFSPAFGMGGYYDGHEGEWNASSHSC